MKSNKTTIITLKDTKVCNCCGMFNKTGVLKDGCTETFKGKMFYFDCQCKSTLVCFESSIKSAVCLSFFSSYAIPHRKDIYTL